MTPALIYAFGIISGVPAGFIVAAWVFRTDRVTPDEEPYGDVPRVER